MTIELQTSTRGAILFDSTLISEPRAELFDAGYWLRQKKVVARQGGRGTVLFIRDDAHRWVLRHYLRGGSIAKILGDRYLWQGAEKTRAFREWRLLHRLRAQGFPVPQPVATRYERSGIWYRADLITATLPAARTLAESITGSRVPEDAWKNIGALIARLHVAGVQHADLNAHNILLGERALVYVLDFDRGCIRSRGAWENKVLARLKRSLLKIQRQHPDAQFEERDWEILLAAYQAALRPQT